MYVLLQSEDKLYKIDEIMLNGNCIYDQSKRLLALFLDAKDAKNEFDNLVRAFKNGINYYAIQKDKNKK